MSLTALAAVPPETFTPEDQKVAREASRALSRLNGRGAVHVEAEAAAERQSFILPAAAVRLVTEVLVELAAGRSVTVMPTDTMLTTQHAADMLNISRPYLIRLLEEGKLPFTKAGTHRKIKLEHLMAYRLQRDARANAAMDFLAAQAQELDMGY